MSIFDTLRRSVGLDTEPPRPTLARPDEGASASPSSISGDPGAGQLYRLDAIGQVCPVPLVEAKQAIAGLSAGDRLEILFDCTQATDSIPQWAADQGYPVTDFRRTGDAEWTLTVQKV